jgi:erythromycin esterase-like protein
VGFTTYSGTVTAANDWGDPPLRKTIKPALRGSIEETFHNTGLDRFFVWFEGELKEALSSPKLERAIGVIYRPETERQSHYFDARLSDQFDAVIHIDRTAAVEPMKTDSGWDNGDAMETFPSGI